MKVGTLSLNINTVDLNYGAMLHSWAFLEFLRKYKSIETAEIINYITPSAESFEWEHPVWSNLKLHRWSSAVKLTFASKAYKNRWKKFKEFTRDHMRVSEKAYTNKKLMNSSLEYDCLICESDVIWSPFALGEDFDDAFFLASDDMKTKKKIIYAASTGNGVFTENEKEKFQSLIKCPDFISCRELYGTELIRECGRSDAVTVIDPVLLLKAEDYDNITSDRLIKNRYLLVYIPLGFDARYMEAANQYAQKYDLEVVEVSYYVWNSRKHRVMADAGIEDFLSLIKNADVIFTNSFHAVCFSCLFHKQFYAFERKTGRKTEDLCARLNLSDHYMCIEDFHECSMIDFSEVDSLLTTERRSSISWLDKALEA